jgi:hypothetical protein
MKDFSTADGTGNGNAATHLVATQCITRHAVRSTQMQNVGTDFPGYNIEYIVGA